MKRKTFQSRGERIISEAYDTTANKCRAAVFPQARLSAYREVRDPLLPITRRPAVELRHICLSKCRMAGYLP